MLVWSWDFSQCPSANHKARAADYPSMTFFGSRLFSMPKTISSCAWLSALGRVFIFDLISLLPISYTLRSWYLTPVEIITLLIKFYHKDITPFRRPIIAQLNSHFNCVMTFCIQASLTLQMCEITEMAHSNVWNSKFVTVFTIMNS